MVSPTKLAHVVYRTHRFAEMIDWYTTVLEAKVSHNNGTLAFLSWDDEHHRLAILNLGTSDDPVSATGVGVHHVAYTWDTLSALLETYERLRDVGIKPVVKLRHGMTLSMYYADPDGNQSELQIDILTPDAADEFMLSDAFRANPIGETFDPEELLIAFKAGEDVTPLLFRSDQDPVAVPAAQGAGIKGRTTP